MTGGPLQRITTCSASSRVDLFMEVSQVAQYEILFGPGIDQLMDALKHRKYGFQVYFTVRKEGERDNFRLYTCIDGLEYDIDVQDIWRVTSSSENLVGRYSSRTRKGTFTNITATSNPSIATLGFDRDVQERLYSANIHTLADLVSLEEVAVVRRLLDDDLGYGINISMVATAARRFEKLRDRLNELGHHLAGQRRDLQELCRQAF